MKNLLWLPFFFALAAASAAASDAPQSKPTPDVQAKSSIETVDELFDRLAKADDEDEAAGIVGALEAMWMRSGSDTGELLASRALGAFAAQDYSLALSLLDTVVAVDPDWAEGWNERATVRFHAGDAMGSAADVAETLKRNPRHIGALAGLAAILEEAGQRDNALKVYERALKLAPHYKPLEDATNELKAKMAGQAL
jgi:tetratricopeptide (TPR) repeat protein